MKNKYLSVALVSALASMNVANAEKSSVFAGVEAGFNIATSKVDVISIYNTSTTQTQYRWGGTYGILVGYKQFFTPHIGLRYYANFNYKHGNYLGDFLPTFSTINYGANIDFLGNFISSDDVDFGGFVGLGIGGNTSIRIGSATNLDVGLNAGLRATFDSNKTIELGTRVSFLPTTIPNYDWSDWTHYSISLRYIHNF